MKYESELIVWTASFAIICYYLFKRTRDETDVRSDCDNCEENVVNILKEKIDNCSQTDNDEFIHLSINNNDFPLCETIVCDVDYYPLSPMDEDTTLGECVVFMTENKIPCGIVKANPAELLDMFDICTYLLDHDNLNIPIIGLSKHFSYVNNTTRLKTIVGHLKNGLRYIAVCEDRIPIGIISQGVVLRHLFKNIEIPHGSVSEYQVGKTHIIHAKDDMTAYECMKTMLKYDITSLPIVTCDDEAIGVIALSDYRCVAFDKSIDLNDNVKVFLEKSRQLLSTILNKKMIPIPTSCSVLFQEMKKFSAGMNRV